MKKKYKNLTKNIGLFAIGSFGSKIVAFLMLPLYTNVLSTKDFGTADLIHTTAQLLMPFLLLSIQDATLRFGMDNNYDKSDVLSSSVRVISKGSLILILGIVFCIVTNIVSMTLVYWLFLFFTFFLGSIINCFNLYLKSKNKASIIAISGIICTFFTCFFNVIFLVFYKAGIVGYMLSSIIALSLQGIYQIIFGRIYEDIHIIKYNDISKEMTKYSRPLIANSVAWWVNNASDRYILSWISGVAVNGIYAVSYKIPTILTTFQNIFYNAWSISAIAEYDSNDVDGFIGNNYTLYSFFSIIICSVIILLNIPITSFLYAKEYFTAWKCVPFLLVATVLSGISQLEGSLFAAERKTKEVAKTTVIGSVVNIIFNFILIYLIGALGAALSTLIGYFFTWFLRTNSLKKFVRMKVNWKKHYLSLLLLLIQSVLATFNILLPIQCGLFLLIVILYKNIIKIMIFKKTKTPLKSDN